jgi:phage tail sheath protein FI
MQTVTRRTPGVYLTELDAFPPSVVGVQTAVPAFIGYTEKALKNGQSILHKPTQINSMEDFEAYFGGAPKAQFTIEDTTPAYTLAWGTGKFFLYNSMRLFYDNGGGLCYVVSVGSYTDTIKLPDFEGGLTAIGQESGPTMLLAPDAMFLDDAGYATLISNMLRQAADKQDRVVLLDVHGGDAWETTGETPVNVIDQFRTNVGSVNLNYGISYFPWLNTSIVQSNEVDFTNIGDSSIADLQAILTKEAARLYVEPKKAEVDALITKLNKTPPAGYTITSLSQDIGAAVPLLFSIYTDMQRHLNILPPTSAMAGIYTMIDTSRGVWKAPANVALTSVVSPTLYINDDTQADLNVPLYGKAVNALRSFPGQGVVVWGARTLDGNSQDYRYVNVRRTLIYIEQSLKIAASSFLFEPNNANTWVSVKSMIDNFLMSVWQGGGLMGDKASDAYQVSVGLGQTMTGNDVLDGYMRVQVLLQLLRPAEFIELTFQQQMQGV